MDSVIGFIVMVLFFLGFVAYQGNSSPKIPERR